MQTAINERPALANGQSADDGKAKYELICRGAAAGADDGKYISDALATLTLPVKKGTEVYYNYSPQKNADEEMEPKDKQGIYEDLYACYAAMRMALKGEECADTSKLGYNVKDAFGHILIQVQHMLPSGYEFNIDRTEKGMYYITLYHGCSWDMEWQTLEVGPAFKKLRRNKALHGLFLSFLKKLHHAGIGLWDDGQMDYALYMLREGDWLEEEKDKEVLKKISRDVLTYTRGRAAEYAMAIRNAPDVTAEEMQKRAKRFKAGNPIANLIYQGCEVLKEGYSLRDYEYLSDDYDDGLLRLENQCNILWQYDDSITKYTSETLEAEANSGICIQEPKWYLPIYPDTTEIDLVTAKMEISWPARLINWMGRAMTLLTEFNADKVTTTTPHE